MSLGPAARARRRRILINLDTYESVIVVALHWHPVLTAAAACGSRDRQSAQYVVRRLAIIVTLDWLMTIGGIIRIVVPQIAVTIGSNIYGGRANTIVAALIIGIPSAFLNCQIGKSRADDTGLSRPHGKEISVGQIDRREREADRQHDG
jgi:hypothetical protein